MVGSTQLSMTGQPPLLKPCCRW